MPREQTLQADEEIWPLPVLYLPALHNTHIELFKYDPGGQSLKHCEAPSIDTFPFGHCLQTGFTVPELNSPIKQV